MEIQKIKLELVGIKPLMFDRFISMDGKSDIQPEEKFHFNEKKEIVIPGFHINAFLTSEQGNCAPKLIYGRKWKGIARAALSFCDIVEETINITNDNGVNLTLDNSNWYTATHVAKVKKTGGLTVPSPKSRPVIPVPWQITFHLNLIENNELNLKRLEEIFSKGGIMSGLGTYRPIYGRFYLKNINVV